jgi:hypothetical protein
MLVYIRACIGSISEAHGEEFESESQEGEERNGRHMKRSGKVLENDEDEEVSRTGSDVRLPLLVLHRRRKASLRPKRQRRPSFDYTRTSLLSVKDQMPPKTRECWSSV